MSAESAAEQTFLFADMAGFTALTEVMGDHEAIAAADEFFAGARELLDEYGATEVKTIGDALMLRVQDAAEAIRLGVRLVCEVGVRHGLPSVRVGMHTGTAVPRGDDWLGATVNLAARVSGAAGSGEALLTESTRVAASELSDIDLVERGRQSLRNVAEPVLLFRAVPLGGARDEDALPIDPVCRMAVDPARQAGSLLYEGREYRFCSLECAQRFAAGPERFVSS